MALQIRNMPEDSDYLYEVEFKGVWFRFYTYLAAELFVANKLRETL